MDTMYERCCGLDIHKKTIEACFRSGKKKTHMSFGTKVLQWKVLALTGSQSLTFWSYLALT